MRRLKEKMVAWVNKKIDNPRKGLWLFILAFSESSFFPIPPDVLLIGILLTKERARAYRYAFITTVSSVAGGVFGYLIGLLLFDTVGAQIVDFYHLQEEVQYIGRVFSDNAFLSILVSAFTPIPYKVFTISAGLFSVPFIPFFIASVVGRGARFYLEAALLKKYGPSVSKFIKKWFDLISIGIILLIVIALIIFK
ncbi:DedA family protein [Candidatus Nomurabacteria bacterium]|nr:DedA family protein [Candidatus Nomurabacteria bacterium]